MSRLIIYNNRLLKSPQRASTTGTLCKSEKKGLKGKVMRTRRGMKKVGLMAS